MQCFCNSWHVRHLLVMVLRLSKSLKLAESIVSWHPHQTAQAQRQLSSITTVNIPLLACHQQFRRRPLSVASNFHGERSSPQTAGNLNISNYTILNTFRLHARRTWLFTVCPDSLNPLSVFNSTLTKIQSKNWTNCPTSNTLKTSQTRSRNHCHLLCLRPKRTPAPRNAEWLHCLAIGTRHSGLPWEEPTKQSIVPICDVWRVQIYPVCNQEEGHEDVLWPHAEGRNHRFVFRKIEKWGWHPEARD